MHRLKVRLTMREAAVHAIVAPRMITAKRRLLEVLAIVPLLVCISSLSGQQPDETSKKHQKFWQLLRHLSRDELSRFETAKTEAQKKPEVQAANKRRKDADAEYRRLLHAEMLKVDPSLKSLLERIAELSKHNDI
jgi:hypothetical protein